MRRAAQRYSAQVAASPSPTPMRTARTDAPTGAPGVGFDFSQISIHPRARPVPRAVVAADSREERDADRLGERIARGAAPRSAATAPTGDSGALPIDVRQRWAPAFGASLDAVRVHTGVDADRAASALRARAFTVGHDIYFRRGAYAPLTAPGSRLLAHEVAHTVQQRSGEPRIHRSPDDEKDPLCETFDLAAASADVTAKTATYKASKSLDDGQMLIRALKLIRRCATADEQTATHDALTVELGADADAIWTSSGTALGGFTGMYPGFAPDIKKRLVKLGASDTVDFGTFAVSEYGDGTEHKKAAKSRAKKELADLARTDIIYFRGHQFAQYKAPGVFTDGNVEKGFDLRYIDQVGGFPNVKVMISTSCATLCTATFDLFHALFPNAVLLGYVKSAPVDGVGVRDAFDAGIKDLKRPLLLDQSVDIAAIVAVWKSVVETKHKGDDHPWPACWDGATLSYWDGTAWQTAAPSSTTVKCRNKGDDSTSMPGP